MINIFNVNNWSKLERTLAQKPNILLSQFSIIAMLGGLVQVIHDSLYLNISGVIMDFGIVVIAFVAYLFNERKKHLLAKFIFSYFGISFIFSFASVVPKGIGAYLVFFPMVTITFLIFNNERAIFKYLSVAFILLLLFILEITNYQPFGSINITDGVAESTSFYVNLVISFFVLIIAMHHMDSINKEIDKDRLKALKEVEDKNKELEVTNEELDHFVYSASHDLKAPLSSILGLINLAKYEVNSPVAMEYFERIENRVGRLTRFIKEVIEISRNTRTSLNFEQVDLTELIDEIIENNNYIDGASKIKIATNLRIEKAVKVDRARLEVVLNNIISNAMKYTNPKQRMPKIEISAWLKGKKLVIKITDNGIGIQADQQEKIFDMFYRGIQSKEGSGLGLYIVKSILLKLEAKYEMKSEFGVGTTFLLTIPVKVVR